MDIFNQQSRPSVSPSMPQGNSNPLYFRTLAITQTSYPGIDMLNQQPGPSVLLSMAQDLNYRYETLSQLLELITDMYRPSSSVGISSDSSSSGRDIKPTMDQLKDEILKVLMEPLNQLMDKPPPELSEEEWLFRMAKSYQDSMKLIPIPVDRDNVIPYKTWEGLAWSMKQIYKQPLHYLTNLQLKEWDQQRHGTEDEWIQLNILIHPVIAETTIWSMEEVHRRHTSPKVLTKLWKDDTDYRRHIDDIHAKPQS